MLTNESHDVAINYLFPGGDITKKDLYRFEETLPALLFAEMMATDDALSDEKSDEKEFDHEEENILDSMIFSPKTLRNNITRAEMSYQLEATQRKQNGNMFPRCFVDRLP